MADNYSHLTQKTLKCLNRRARRARHRWPSIEKGALGAPYIATSRYRFAKVRRFLDQMEVAWRAHRSGFSTKGLAADIVIRKIRLAETPFTEVASIVRSLFTLSAVD